MRRINRRLIAVLAAIGAATMPMGVVLGASPHVIDGESLSPALNPLYAPYDCWRAGGGITCRGEVEGTYGPEITDWWECGDATIYFSGRERQHITRWHDAAGNATKTTLATEFREVFSLDPSGAGPSITMLFRFTKHYDYLVPGDRDTRVMRTTGVSLIARASDGGGVLGREVGWVEFAPGEEDETVTDRRGPSDFIDDWDGFVERACAHLLGG